MIITLNHLKEPFHSNPTCKNWQDFYHWLTEKYQDVGMPHLLDDLKNDLPFRSQLIGYLQTASSYENQLRTEIEATLNRIQSLPRASTVEAPDQPETLFIPIYSTLPVKFNDLYGNWEDFIDCILEDNQLNLACFLNNLRFNLQTRLHVSQFLAEASAFEHHVANQISQNRKETDND